MASALRRVIVGRNFPVAQETHFRLLRRSAVLQTTRFASDASLPDKFQGRRSTLDVKVPDLEEPETSSQIDPANVPFVPDLYHSEAKSAEIEADKAKSSLADTSPTPKVVTASAESTLPGMGVSSNVFQKTEELKAFTGVEAEKMKEKTEGKLQDATETLKGWAANIQLPGLGSTEAGYTGGKTDPSRTELDRNDVQGLYVLLGIVGGGWLLGGLLSKKGTQPAKHGHSH